MPTSDLSGARWWKANQDKFPNSRDIDNLESGFRSNVEQFLTALRAGGAVVVVNSTRRNADRAYLMHYSWEVGYGETDPSEVPSRSGVTIEWDHGDQTKSRDAALEMVALFDLAHKPSLTSNHIAGKAIDMDIKWKGTLVLSQPAPLLQKIESTPRTGGNSELQAVGAEVFGVRKLKSDPPHWSTNGH